MTPNFLTVDREVVENSFRQWQAEQTLLDAQLDDSLAALEAYQLHLDTWQQELAREREELRQLRASIDRDQAGNRSQREQVEQLNRELGDARHQITTLTAALLARTEELRELDQQRGSASTEMAVAQVRELDLAAALAAQQHSFEAQRQQWERDTAKLRDELQRAQNATSAADTRYAPANSNVSVKAESRSASPVLGSVMEQFGKLRQQRSMSRPNPKPR
jgi:chromosome segregation ATPase